MKNLKLNSCIALGAAVLFAAACSTTGSDSSFSPTGPAFESVVSPKTAVVCKTGPAGTYSFTASATGDDNTGDLLDASFDLVLANDGDTECATAFTRTVSDDTPCTVNNQPGTCDDPAAILITESAHAGTTLNNITTTGPGAQAANVNLAGSQVTLYINAFHSDQATFYNVAVPEGCTYTQGWYKNHETQWPSGYSPNDLFDQTGLTWLELYKTPPKKGSAYIQLAHQYMTALMNSEGASVPADVQTALNKAAAYFASSTTPFVGTTDITGVAAILDAYNNGITGPGHCGDEIIIID